MRSAILTSPRSVRISEIPKPTAETDHFLVRVKATALCGTDVGVYEGNYAISYPRIMGHESTGVIEDLGPGATAFTAGDRVAINPVFFCDMCQACSEGHQNMCLRGGLLGREKDGTLAEYVTLPGKLLAKLPAKVGFEEGTLIQLLSTVLHGFKRVGSVSGKTVTILGQGASGLLFTRLCKISGADDIIAVSRTEWKLDLAQRQGATKTVNARKGDTVKEVTNLTQAKMGSDLVIESAGSVNTMSQSLELARRGGSVLLFGILSESLRDFSTFPLYYKEIKVLGSRAATPSDFEAAANIVEKGEIELLPFVSKIYELERVDEALRALSSGSEQSLRFVVSI